MLNLTWVEGAPEEYLAGMLIEEADGSLTLIGDVNPLGGLCDCCGSRPEAVRYAILELPRAKEGPPVFDPAHYRHHIGMDFAPLALCGWRGFFEPYSTIAEHENKQEGELEVDCPRCVERSRWCIEAQAKGSLKKIEE